MRKRRLNNIFSFFFFIVLGFAFCAHYVLWVIMAIPFHEFGHIWSAELLGCYDKRSYLGGKYVLHSWEVGIEYVNGEYYATYVYSRCLEKASFMTLVITRLFGGLSEALFFTLLYVMSRRRVFVLQVPRAVSYAIWEATGFMFPGGIAYMVVFAISMGVYMALSVLDIRLLDKLWLHGHLRKPY